MNKRQKKKEWNKYIGSYGRSGCDICFGATARIFKGIKGDFINVSLGTERKKMTLRIDREPVGYIETSYCWNCGRKLR